MPVVRSELPGSASSAEASARGGLPMMAVNGQANGHARHDLLTRLIELDEQFLSRRKERDAESSYAAGESGRMNPVPQGIDPLGTDADYHYRTERNYFLMVERRRAAVRNH